MLMNKILKVSLQQYRIFHVEKYILNIIKTLTVIQCTLHMSMRLHNIFFHIVIKLDNFSLTPVLY